MRKIVPLTTLRTAVPKAVRAYLRNFSKSLRKILERRSVRTHAQTNFHAFVATIVLFVVIFAGAGASRSAQWQNDFESEFASLEKCYAAEIRLMQEIHAEIPDQLRSLGADGNFRSEWIDSFLSAVQSMRFRDLYIWSFGRLPNTADGFTNPKHDFFPEYDGTGGGIPLLVSEDENIKIERRSIDTEEPRYSLIFRQESFSLIYQVQAAFDSPDIENCGG